MAFQGHAIRCVGRRWGDEVKEILGSGMKR